MSDREPNYFPLLLVIIVGVTVGNLLSTLITAKVIEYQAQVVIAEANRAFQEQNQKAKSEAASAAQRKAALTAQQQEAMRKQRALDPHGIRLHQACEEWQKADASLRSETTRHESAKHCSRYESYIQTGVLPSGK